jgi:hypothetical protein
LLILPVGSSRFSEMVRITNVQTQKQWMAASGMAIGTLAIIAGVVFWSKGEPNAQAQGAPGQPPAPAGQRPAPAGQRLPAPNSGQKQTPAANNQQPKGGVFANTPPAPAKPAGGMTGAPGAVAGQAGAAPQPVYRPPYNPRRDPFALIWKIPPPPPYVFNEVQPVRIASANVTAPPPPNTEIREVPSRRVSGIMSGDGVFAILEGVGGEPEIVKPGSETRDGYKVVSISSDTVTLRKKEGNIIRTQVVPLSDIPPGQQAQIGGAGRFGMPGGPAGMGGPTSSGPSGIQGTIPGRPGGGGIGPGAKE